MLIEEDGRIITDLNAERVSTAFEFLDWIKPDLDSEVKKKMAVKMAEMLNIVRVKKDK